MRKLLFPTRGCVRILCSLVVVALLFDLVFFTGFHASDDREYIAGTLGIVGEGDGREYIAGTLGIVGEGEWPITIGSVRIGITLPSALVWKLSGGSLTAVAGSYMVYHLLLVVIAYLVALSLRDERSGLIAAALVAIDPLIYMFAGTMLPDNAASCWFGAALLALVAIRRFAEPGSRLWSWNRRRFFGYVLAGALLGACYLCKETALILTIPAAAFAVAAAPSWRDLVWVQNGAALMLGLLVVMLGEYLLLRGVTGEWVSRIGIVEGSDRIFQGDMEYQGTMPLVRLLYAGRQIQRWGPVSACVLLCGASAYTFTRGRNVGLVIAFWWTTIYLTLGSTSLSSYLPPTIQGRYYALGILPACVMTALVATTLLERWQARRPSAPTRRVSVAAIALVAILDGRHGLPISGTMYRAPEVRSFLAALEVVRARYPGQPIVLSPYYASRMWPLILDRPDIEADLKGVRRPPPPYVYLKMVGSSDHFDPDPIAPTLRSTKVEEVPTPRSRWSVIQAAVCRVVSSDCTMETGDRKRATEVYLITR